MFSKTENQSSSVTNGSKSDSHNPAPTIKDIVGLSLPHIGTYKKLDNSKQVVALIDDVSFTNFVFAL